MAQHTKWSNWMSENLRYALTINKKEAVKYTYSEYYYCWIANDESHIYDRGIIDIVGKKCLKDNLSDSIVIEIKSSLADINSGKGQNFVGKYNFFATDEAFIETLTEYCISKYGENTVGVLVVHKDGSVSTVLPAFNKNKTMVVESDFAEFATDDEVEEYFEKVVIPHQKYLDAHKPRYNA